MATFPEESRLLNQYRFIKDPKTVAIIGCPFSGGQVCALCVSLFLFLKHKLFSLVQV
ncbi:hypothetical protein FRC16_008647 [Serendipita sp. 398]|nr:hypothetical protein FRC16_008647 [Serendipita sp. 398]